MLEVYQFWCFLEEKAFCFIDSLPLPPPLWFSCFQSHWLSGGRVSLHPCSQAGERSSRKDRVGAVCVCVSVCLCVCVCVCLLHGPVRRGEPGEPSQGREEAALGTLCRPSPCAPQGIHCGSRMGAPAPRARGCSQPRGPFFPDRVAAELGRSSPCWLGNADGYSLSRHPRLGHWVTGSCWPEKRFSVDLKLTSTIREVVL